MDFVEEPRLFSRLITEWEWTGDNLRREKPNYYVSQGIVQICLYWGARQERVYDGSRWSTWSLSHGILYFRLIQNHMVLNGMSDPEKMPKYVKNFNK